MSICSKHNFLYYHMKVNKQLTTNLYTYVQYRKIPENFYFEVTEVQQV